MTEYNRHQKPQEEDSERLLPRIAASSAVAIVIDSDQNLPRG